MPLTVRLENNINSRRAGKLKVYTVRERKRFLRMDKSKFEQGVRKLGSQSVDPKWTLSENNVLHARVP